MYASRMAARPPSKAARMVRSLFPGRAELELQLHVRLRSINPEERPFHRPVLPVPAIKENAT
jgi:hypothetical protein